MRRISEWYTSLGEHSFPTLFIPLTDDQRECLVARDLRSRTARRVMGRLQRAIRHLTGCAFVGADTCAPTDSPEYRRGRWVSFGKTAYRMLATSDKVTASLRSGDSTCLTVRPYRRMDPGREFRFFVRDRALSGVSQYHLDRRYARVANRESEVWKAACDWLGQLTEGLPADDLVLDAYLTSTDRFLIVDLNSWGDPTDPLLFKTWDRDWSADKGGIRFIPKPVRMSGDVSVSF